jgi:hypothetical protein
MQNWLAIIESMLFQIFSARESLIFRWKETQTDQRHGNTQSAWEKFNQGWQHLKKSLVSHLI